MKNTSILERIGPALNLLDNLAPPQQDQPALAVLPHERRAVVGFFRRLKAVATNPIGLFEGGRAASGGKPFALRIPFNFDLTFLPGRAGYKFVLGLPAEKGKMGPVMKRVPTVGSWYPRSNQSPEYLQQLLLAARSYLATEVFTRKRVGEAEKLTRSTFRQRSQKWDQDKIDLPQRLEEIIYDSSAQFIIGKSLWDRLAKDATPLIRDISKGVDVSRTAICHTPMVFFTKEYRATRKLKLLLDQVIEEHDETGRFPILDQIGNIQVGSQILPAEDRSWMLMYILWNAVTYLSPYGVWSVLDVVNNPKAVEALRQNHSPRFVEHCMLETMRVSPVGSLVRHTDEPLEFEHEGKTYKIPPGGYVGTLVWAIHRDGHTYRSPETYNPWRYQHGEPVPSAFGRGAFGCVATRFIREVITTLITETVFGFDIELQQPLPDKIVRVHLLSPKGPITATLKPRFHPEHRLKTSNSAEEAAPLGTPTRKNLGDSASKCPFH